MQYICARQIAGNEQAATNINPAHACKSCCFSCPSSLRTINGTAHLRYIYKQKCYMYFKQDWLGDGGVLVVCQLCVNWRVRPQPWCVFMFTLFCSCLKSKACNESPEESMDILLLANWQNCIKR